MSNLKKGNYFTNGKSTQQHFFYRVSDFFLYTDYVIRLFVVSLLFIQYFCTVSL